MVHFSSWHSHRHLPINPIIRMIILSDLFFWSAWSTVLPLLSVFIVKDIAGGSVSVAATGYSLYILTRVIGTSISGVVFSKTSEQTKVTVLIMSIFTLNISYLGFAFLQTLPFFYTFYALIGIGVGVATPIRAALFSTHLDKHQETAEWATLESIILIGIAICAFVGGYIINQYGFTALFLLAAAFNCFSIFPYITYQNHIGKDR